MIKKGLTLFAALFAVVAVSACNNAQEQAKKRAEHLNSNIYIPRHNIEFRNYNLRQKIADDPSVILWCTFFPPGVQGTGNGSTPGQAFTVPIAGKLTSSGKRPYSDEPGPDAMYGSSSEYRYGFDPTLTTYYDFTNLSSFCTTEPTVWQTQSTKIVVQTDATANALSKAASEEIKQGSTGAALQKLKQVETNSNGGKK